jgi:hypothetical protein
MASLRTLESVEGSLGTAQFLFSISLSPLQNPWHLKCHGFWGWLYHQKKARATDFEDGFIIKEKMRPLVTKTAPKFNCICCYALTV